MMWRFALVLICTPSLSFAACVSPDGQRVTEPGVVAGAMDDRTWLPIAAGQDRGLSETDRASLDMLARDPSAGLLTAECSRLDLFMIHLSALNLAQPDESIVPSALRETDRGWAVPPESAPVYPAFFNQIRAAAR